jgi:hypothetical protein
MAKSIFSPQSYQMTQLWIVQERQTNITCENGNSVGTPSLPQQFSGGPVVDIFLAPSGFAGHRPERFG